MYYSVYMFKKLYSDYHFKQSWFFFFLKKSRGKQSFLCLPKNSLFYVFHMFTLSNASLFPFSGSRVLSDCSFFQPEWTSFSISFVVQYAHDILLIFVYLGIALLCFQIEEYFCFIKNSWLYSLSITLNMSLDCFLASIVSDEKSDVNVVPLWMMNCFSVAVFRIFFEKSLPCSSLSMINQGLILFVLL